MNRPRCSRCERLLVKKIPSTAKYIKNTCVSYTRPKSRNLCVTCHPRCRADGTVTDYPMTGFIMRAPEFIEDREFLLEQGMTDKQICEKFGYKWDSYTRKLLRAGIVR